MLLSSFELSLKFVDPCVNLFDDESFVIVILLPLPILPLDDDDDDIIFVKFFVGNDIDPVPLVLPPLIVCIIGDAIIGLDFSDFIDDESVDLLLSFKFELSLLLLLLLLLFLDDDLEEFLSRDDDDDSFS